MKAHAKKGASESLSFEDTETAFSHKSDSELQFASFIFRTMANRKLVKHLTGLTKVAMQLKLPIKWAIRKTIYQQFVGGENIAACQKVVDKIGAFGIGSILDYSIEGKEHESDYVHTKDEMLRVIEAAKTNNYIPVTVIKITGIARFALLQKVSEGKALNADEQQEYERVKSRLVEICTNCQSVDIPIYIDAEESWIQNAIDGLAEEMMFRFNQNRALVFNTVQLYRWDRLDYLLKLHKTCQKHGVKCGVKLVRGAYLEKENARAEEKGYPTPMQPDKASTDNDYNAALEYCVEHLDTIEVCAGTHNEASSLLLANLLQSKGIPKNHPSVYFAQLYGMSDHMSFNLASHGYNVAKYLPYGPVVDTLPYLIRRAEENTSIAGQMGKELKLLQAEISRRKKR